MTTGSINYSPDYKSNPKAVMDAGESITESLIAANRAAAELERLERNVIEAAREFTDDKCQAVDALNACESNQQRIKR